MKIIGLTIIDSTNVDAESYFEIFTKSLARFSKKLRYGPRRKTIGGKGTFRKIILTQTRVFFNRTIQRVSIK